MSYCAEVTQKGFIDMQVCVPENWTDDQVVEFANRENPAGTSGGWIIRRDSDPLNEGYPERNPCSNRAGFVHIMLSC